MLLLDEDGRYAGVLLTADAYGAGVDPQAAIESLAISRDLTLSPAMNIEAVMRVFETSGTDELAVVDEERRVLGLLAEAYVLRRYATELERQHLELYGEEKD